MKRAATENRRTVSSIEQQTATRRKVETDATASTAISDARRDRLDTSTTTELASDEEVTTTVRVYDTDKPVDPGTGTPPLQRETTQTRRRADTGRQTQTTGQTSDRQRDIAAQVAGRQTDSTALQDSRRHDNDAVIQIDTTEKRGLNTWQKVLCSIGGISLLMGLAWAGIKLYKRFYKPFKTI